MAGKQTHDLGRQPLFRSQTSIDNSEMWDGVLSNKRGCVTIGGKSSTAGSGERRYQIETRIILVGRTGSGKSCTGNTLLGKPAAFSSQSGTKSITKQCKYASCNYKGRVVVVIDTPGLFDTDMSDEEAKTEIVKCLALASPGPHAVLLVIPANVRYTKECQDTIERYLEWFGPEVVDYILPVFTKSDQFQKDLTTEKMFKKNLEPKLEGLLTKSKDRHVFVNNRSGDIEGERLKLFDAIDRIVDSHKTKCFTNKHFEIMEKELDSIETERRSRHNAIQEDSVYRSSDTIPTPPINTVAEGSEGSASSLGMSGMGVEEEPTGGLSRENTESAPSGGLSRENTESVLSGGKSGENTKSAPSERESTRQKVTDDIGFLGRLSQLFSEFFSSFFVLLRGKRS